MLCVWEVSLEPGDVAGEEVSVGQRRYKCQLLVASIESVAIAFQWALRCSRYLLLAMRAERGGVVLSNGVVEDDG